ncbi:MAG: VOC family protein [Verrucomicrobiota bacterium]|jgi:catechol 2,3-dioxygenase-like lactoylglutathione lyase family enzyme
MNFSIEHVAVPAADPATLKNWYVRVLGARVIWDKRQTPPSFLIALGGAWLEIYAAEKDFAGRGDNHLAGWRHVALRVDSLAAAKTELEKRGVDFTEEIRPAGGGGRVLFFKDLEGNLLHLVERPVDSPLGKK